MGNFLSIFFFKGRDCIFNVPVKFEEIEYVDIYGKTRKMSEYKSKKLLIIVNVASSCFYTSQNYIGLMELYNKYK